MALRLDADECSFLAWDVDWLAREAGRAPVKVYHSDRTNFGLAPGAQVQTEEVVLADFLTDLREPAGDGPERHSYLRQLDVDVLRLDREAAAAERGEAEHDEAEQGKTEHDETGSEDRTRWQVDWLTEGQPAVRRNLWVGARGIRTNLHFDGVANVYVQVQGRKTVWLAPPQDLDRIYPYPADSVAHQTSRVDWRAIDAQEFPRAPEAALRSITLHPGDALHIPAFWWHELESEDVSVSVNIWWLPPLERCLVPGLLRRLVHLHGKHGVFAVDKVLRDTFRLDGPDWAQRAVTGLISAESDSIAAEPGAVLALLLLEAALARQVRLRLSPRPAAAAGARRPGSGAGGPNPAERQPGFPALIEAAAAKDLLGAEDASELLGLVRLADQGRAAVLADRAPDWAEGEPAATVRAGLELSRRLAAG